MTVKSNATTPSEFPRAFAVEMAGVEPASDEKTIKTTTYIVCLLRFALSYPTNRTLATQPQVNPLVAGFAQLA